MKPDCKQCGGKGYISYKSSSIYACTITDHCPDCSQEIVFEEVLQELALAQKSWPPLNSAHEGLAVLEEEVFELKRWVYMNQRKRDLPMMRKEAIQVAAMALRFAIEVATEERGRK